MPARRNRNAAALTRLLSFLLLLPLLPRRAVEALQVRPWGSCATARIPSPAAECTTAVVPLCYDDLCTDDTSATITLSLTRLPAKTNANAGSSAPRIAWVIPDRSDVVLPSEGQCVGNRLCVHRVVLKLTAALFMAVVAQQTP